MRKIIESELACLARFLLSRFRPFVIGVTGSSGKTTVKYFIGELIEATGRSVKVAPGNLNTKTGLPLSILGFSKSPKNYFEWLLIAIYSPLKALLTFKFEKFLILEYAIDTPGDMQKLIDITPSDIAVITSLGSAHIEIFKTEQAIAQEKWKLAESARVAVIANKRAVEKITIQNLTAQLYALPSMKFAKAENVRQFTNRTEFDLYLSNIKKEVEFKFFGKHNIENLELAAFAAYLATGEKSKILTAVKNLQPLAGRGKRVFIKALDILVIDESYNANPASMKAALSTLRQIKPAARRVAILGQMAEIGPIVKEAHEDIVKVAKESADYTIGVGEAFKDSTLDIWYENVTELNKNIAEIIKKGDVVLIKGSRSNELDKTVNLLEEL